MELLIKQFLEKEKTMILKSFLEAKEIYSKDEANHLVRKGLEYGVVYTHSGREFHADEVFALALLDVYREWQNQILGYERYPKFEVIRGRKIECEEGILKIDVDQTFLDHHFPAEQQAVRENGVPYASAGLLWAFIGNDFLDNPDRVDEELFLPIDAIDNGVEGYNSQFSMMVADMNSTWDDEGFDLEDAMHQAIEMAKTILKNKIKVLRSKEKAISIVKQAYDAAENKEIVILDKCIPWQQTLVPTEAKFVIWEGDMEFCAQAVPVEAGSFTLKKGFNPKWRGLRGDELLKASGLNLEFCHSTGFYLVADSLEDAIEACKVSLSV
jgi:uncharacterized UPF0160 family protein